MRNVDISIIERKTAEGSVQRQLQTGPIDAILLPGAASAYG